MTNNTFPGPRTIEHLPIDMPVIAEEGSHVTMSFAGTKQEAQDMLNYLQARRAAKTLASQNTDRRRKHI